MTDTHPLGTVNWMLDDLTGVDGVLHAVAVSGDGMVIQTSARIHRNDADQLAAMTSSLSGIAQGVAHHFGGGAVQQTVIEMDDRYLLVTAAGPNALLAVLATSDDDTDVGLIGYQMNRLASQVSGHLSSPQRSPAPEA